MSDLPDDFQNAPLSEVDPDIAASSTASSSASRARSR